MKKLVKALLPPILVDAARAIASPSPSQRSTPVLPSWQTIEGGLLAGYKIFVPRVEPAFSAMIDGSYDSFFWQFLQSLDLANATVFDIGGHIGYHTLAFAKLVGEAGKVWVFEPNPANLARMSVNFEANPELAARIQIVGKALSDTPGETTFHFSTNVDDQTSFGGYLDRSYAPLPGDAYKQANFTTTTVETITLDRFCELQDISALHLLKVDVEGAEYMVLEGARSAIATFRPLILVEVHSIQNMLFLCQALLPLQYELRLLEEGSMSRCFVAALPKAVL